MGAWIEIFLLQIILYNVNVAPLVGAWIEIVCGIICIRTCVVAPLVGAWIEIFINKRNAYLCRRRSPCGSVD